MICFYWAFAVGIVKDTEWNWSMIVKRYQTIDPRRFHSKNAKHVTQKYVDMIIFSRAFSPKRINLFNSCLRVETGIIHPRTCVEKNLNPVWKHCALAKIVRSHICHLNLFLTNFGSFCKERKTYSEFICTTQLRI